MKSLSLTPGSTIIVGDFHAEARMGPYKTMRTQFSDALNNTTRTKAVTFPAAQANTSGIDYILPEEQLDSSQEESGNVNTLAFRHLPLLQLEVKVKRRRVRRFNRISCDV